MSTPKTRRAPVTVSVDYTPIDPKRITPRGAAIIAHVVRDILLAPKGEAGDRQAQEGTVANG